MATTVSDQSATAAPIASAPAAMPADVAAAATAPAIVKAYRDYLLPLIAGWRARGARVAIFGVGQHTPDLLALVPELEALGPAAYLDSKATGDTTYRGRPLLPLGALQNGGIDVVVCSSYLAEMQQLRLLDAYPVKAFLSHPPFFSAGAVPQFLLVPTFGYPVVVPPPRDEHVEALAQKFADDWPVFETTVRTLSPFFEEMKDIPDEAVDEVTPYWNNDYFGGSDARVAYAMIRAHRPRRIVEIGSGNSTKFLRRAITRNGGGTELISIDPSPRAGVDSLCERIVRLPLQRVPIETFDILEPGDFLFMDGTHQVFHGTDTVFFFLRLLPRIAAGIKVHIHDITLPYQYPQDYIDRYYAEQYVLGALLLGGDTWRTTAPVHYLHERGLLAHPGWSFWMERR